MRRFGLLLLLSGLLCADYPWQGNWNCATDQWSPSLDTIGTAGNFRKGGGAQLFSPIGQDCGCVLFGQAQGGIFRDLYAGSLGIGYRKMAEPGQYSWGHYFAWGVNAFFDIARSNSGEGYYQGGIGGEILGDCWLFRVNGYLPSRGRHTLSRRRESTVFTVANPNGDGELIFSDDRYFNLTEQGYHGFDLEIGSGMQIGCGQLWGYAGYYHFDASGCHSQQGPRFRLEYTLDQTLGWCPLELTLGGEWDDDKVHGSTIAGYFSARLPLYRGCNTRRSLSCCDGICRLMGDPVFRNRAIWVDREERLAELRREQVSRIFFAQGTGMGLLAGTQTNPQDIDAAFASADQPGDIIFALPGMGNLEAAGVLPMLANQQLWSFGTQGRAEIDLGGGRILTVTPLSAASGAAATVKYAAAASDSLIQLQGASTNHTIGGIILDGTGLTVNAVQVVLADGGQPGVNLHATDSAFIGMLPSGTPTGAEAVIVGTQGAPFNTLALHRCSATGTGTPGILLQEPIAAHPGLSIEIIRSEVATSGAASIDPLSISDNGDTTAIVRGTRLAIGEDSSNLLAMSSDISQFGNVNLLVDNSTLVGGPTTATEGSGVALSYAAGGTRQNIGILNSEIGTTGSLVNAINMQISQPNPVVTSVSERAIVANNQLGSEETVALMLAAKDAGSSFHALVTDNVAAPEPGQDLLQVVVASPNPAFVTVRNNTNTMGPVANLLIGTSVIEVCATIDGNTFNTGADITLNNNGARFAATNLGILSPLNNGTPVSVPNDPITTSVIPCPLP